MSGYNLSGDLKQFRGCLNEILICTCITLGALGFVHLAYWFVVQVLVPWWSGS